MAADASAYASLGLEPDADAAAIERAYRRLIKQHHPDREGGDAIRAAEINRAYREIRAERMLKDPLELNDDDRESQPRAHGWFTFALLLAIVLLGLLLSQASVGTWGQWKPASIASSPAKGQAQAARIRDDPMDQPLHETAIDGAVHDAVRLSHGSDEMALARESRDCHHSLRTEPTIVQLDRCAAFDDAVVQLQDRDPLRDQGPFSELAVTGRIWSGAAALSDDSVAIDGRLDRIRLRVELGLASMASTPARPSVN